MKNIKLILSFTLLFAAFINCSVPDGIDQDSSFLNSAATGSLATIFDISNDNSGDVKITPTGEGATSFSIDYGHGSGESTRVWPGESTVYAYPEGSYSVKVIAADIAGGKTETEYPLQVIYRAPEDLQVSTSGEMEVSATATYAKSFLAYYGDVTSETGTPMAIGQTLPAHTYPATGGPFVLKVVALSGGAATTEFQKTLFGFPLDFESPAMDYFFGTFGNVTFSKVPNPDASGLNTSAMVGEYTKPVGATNWSGTYSPLNIPVNFEHGNKIKVLVYNPDPENIGKKINIELEWPVGGTPENGVAVLKVPITSANQWEELVFDFSANTDIPDDAKFTQFVFRFNDSSDGAGEIIYIDNIILTN